LAESALGIARQIGDPEQTALAIHMLGLADRGQERWDPAASLMEEALVQWRALGLPTNEAMALANLGVIAYRQGDAALSARRAEEALALFRATGHAAGAARALSNLARLAADQGDDWQARSAYQESLELLAGIGERWFIIQPFIGLARLAAAHDRLDQTALLIGAVDTCLDDRGFIIFPDDHSTFDRVIVAARNALGEERFTDLRASGRTFAMWEAIDLALAVTLPERPSLPRSPNDPARQHHPPS